MPQFFFHLRTAQGLDVDDVGTPFPNLDTAYLDVCRAIPEMVTGLLGDGHDPMRCAFEIRDEHGRLLMEVPFAERLTKAVSQPRPAAAVTDEEAALNQLFRSAASNRAEAEKLRRSIRETRCCLVRTIRSGNTPYLDIIARAYGLLELGAGGST